ncbi:type II restriction endonuclease [Mycoplasmopsis gallopavonis]|uniref:R.HinP1I restriction endonuclease n=1 Tax=Mycoplasmopsis gallopavonis TaxID=76629 RepID=A0A449AZW4_9BACT|nr:type II restriction endonuclease [Mycoplasmopsis gallopavonis]RIV16889.1 type II restriction endonuclease [Mycoplasmopsis gallopavonis]VEU73032.1 R.HinP1I restriction endonuclease [Mycoplasmopsis gallopavonis]
MNNLNKKDLGSQIAKNGFQNEKDIAQKFIFWQNDREAQNWLKIMGHSILSINQIKVNFIKGQKSDIVLEVRKKSNKFINKENIQIKLVSNKKGFNQVDKRWLKSYKELWEIPENIFELFQYFTGEKKPYKVKTKSEKRMFITEFSNKEQEEILSWIDKNKKLIISDILKGRGEFQANWVLVTQKSQNESKWVLKNIEEVIKIYLHDGKIKISPRGSLVLGKVTIQRKGGDGGRKTANMLQFKIDPSELFRI